MARPGSNPDLLNKVIFNESISFAEAIIYVFSHNFFAFSLLASYLSTLQRQSLES